MVLSAEGKRLLEICDSAAIAVSESITKMVGDPDSGQVMQMGADGTPTKSIDRRAEEAVVGVLERSGIDFAILSEELGRKEIGKNPKYFLHLDPLDGTFNAIAGLPFYSVSLAIGTNSLKDVEAGLVQNLVTGDTYYAEKGKGAYLNDKPIRTRSFNPYKSIFLVYLGKYASADNFHFARMGVRARALGCASLEMCLLAEGKVDAYYMNCEVHEKSIRVVDIAASTLILREAGGEVVDLMYHPLDMKFDLKERSNFLAYGDAEVRKVVM